MKRAALGVLLISLVAGSRAFAGPFVPPALYNRDNGSHNDRGHDRPDYRNDDRGRHDNDHRSDRDNWNHRAEPRWDSRHDDHRWNDNRRWDNDHRWDHE